MNAWSAAYATSTAVGIASGSAVYGRLNGYGVRNGG
jgi:hypothetical protein